MAYDIKTKKEEEDNNSLEEEEGTDGYKKEKIGEMEMTCVIDNFLYILLIWSKNKKFSFWISP